MPSCVAGKIRFRCLSVSASHFHGFVRYLYSAYENERVEGMVFDLGNYSVDFGDILHCVSARKVVDLLWFLFISVHSSLTFT